MKGNNVIAAAVLLGCIIIAIAHYLGLKSQAVAPPPAKVEAPAETAPTPNEPPLTTANAPATLPPIPVPAATVAPTEAEVEAATVEASKVVATKKADLAKRCWAPLIAAIPEPALGKYALSMGFSADGKLIRYEVNMMRNAARPDVAECLMKNPLSLSVRPPGKPVNVNVPLEFP